MLGLLRTVMRTSSKRAPARKSRKITESPAKKLSQVMKRNKWSGRPEDMPKPGSREAYQILKQMNNSSVDYSVPERILTLDDIETNREANAVNGRLRHLVNTGGSAEEGLKLCEEAQEAGIQLDVQSWVYLSALLKPALPKAWEAVAAHVEAGVSKFFQEYVPDSNAIAQALKDVHGPEDQDVLAEIVSLVRKRSAKLDFDAVTALRAAYNLAAPSQGPSVIEQLHKEYLIDTPTYDNYSRLSASL
jgi:hypothetical protein